MNVAANVRNAAATIADAARAQYDTDRTPAQVIDTAMGHGHAVDIALRQARQEAHAMAGECARLAFALDPEQP